MHFFSARIHFHAQYALTSLTEHLILPLCVVCLGSRASSQRFRGSIDYTPDPGARGISSESVSD